MAFRRLLALAAVSLLGLAFASAAQAADFTANQLDDGASDNVCDAAATCTIRDAVFEAMNTTEADVITAGPGTHELDGSPIVIDSGNGAVTINGAGSGSTVVDGNNTSRVFEVNPDVVGTLTKMTIQGGFACCTGFDHGGGILNGGDLTLDGVVMRSNYADEDGGAIENSIELFILRAGADDDVPDLLIKNSQIGMLGAGDANTADQGDGGGISNKGGVVTLENTAVEGNLAQNDGGGINNEEFSAPVSQTFMDVPHVLNVTKGSRVDNNQTFEGEGAGLKGTDESQITVTDSQVRGNLARNHNGGGISVEDGTVLTVLRSLVENNVSLGFSDGGGIIVQDESTVSITETTIRGNVVDNGGGGGISNEGDSALELVRSTISGNGFELGSLDLRAARQPSGLSADGAQRGGGLNVESGGTVSVENSTISGNHAYQLGGGLYVAGGDLPVTPDGGPGLTGFTFSQADLLHVTLANNTVPAESKGPGGAGIYIEEGFEEKQFGPGVVNAKSTLIANNTLAPSSTKDNCAGEPPNSDGTNLEDEDDCEFSSSGGDGDLVNTNPVIGSLAANGGPTQTHALLSGSPAIDAAGTSGCPGQDQRNVVRPQGPACDIGAYEVEVAQPAATTTPAAPPPARPARPRVSVAGVRRACVRRSFSARFRISTASGVTIRSVRLTVDGRRVRTRTRSRFSVRINVSRLRAGRHRLRLVVTDSAGNRTTVNRRFTKCAQRAQRRSAPRFTG